MFTRNTLPMIAACALAGIGCQSQSFGAAKAPIGEATLTSATVIRAKAKTPEKERPLVQIALLLDTSGSMSGMINQAKTQLWSIVNQFIKVERKGLAPRVQVALYHYGSPSLGSENGYIKQLAPLTDDLDKVAEELFKLGTSGGSEYCGWAVRTSTDQLAWSKDKNAYKAIFIAGNESFAQGSVDYRKTCKDAIAKGIIVNTIHCSGGSDEGWRDGSVLADGNYLKIDTNKVVAEVATPHDAELAKLNGELNKTYVGFGAKGAELKKRQMANDKQSSGISSANMAQRIVSKASGNYGASSWDLVDAVKNGTKLDKVKKKDLPKEMQEMTAEKRKTHVDELGKQRVTLQKQILELNTKREKFVAGKQKELAKNSDTLGSQVEQTIMKQIKAKGFTLKK
jgi:hypothetical protein